MRGIQARLLLGFGTAIWAVTLANAPAVAQQSRPIWGPGADPGAEPAAGVRRGSAEPVGAARFLDRRTLDRALQRQRDFIPRLEAQARGKGVPDSPEYIAELRTGLAEAAPKTGQGGRDLAGAAQDLDRIESKIESHDTSPRVRRTLKRFLDEAKRGKRIFGGAPTPPGVFRETVAIHRRSTDQVCSGALIDRNAVLTAAHCVCDLALNNADTDAVVKVGDDIQESGTRSLRLQPERTVMRDMRFCEKAKANGTGFVPGVDLAVVFFREDVAAVRVQVRGGPFIYQQGNWVDENGAFRVSAARIADDSLYLGSQADELMIVGFGLNNRSTIRDLGIKMFAEVPIYSQICGSADIDISTGCAPGREALLVDWKYHERDTCGGDSGGPAFLVRGDKYYLAAVTSRAADLSGNCGAGGIYSLITPGVLSWLKTVVRLDPVVASLGPR